MVGNRARMALIGAVAVAAIGGRAGAAAPLAAGSAPDCAALARLALAEADTRIVSAVRVPAAAAGTVKPTASEPFVSVPLPAHCRVSGVLDERTGADGKRYGIRFAIALPDEWNGRFLMQGGGGLNGTLNPPLGAQATGAVPALARGFAVASTDGGHQGAVFDAAFQADQQATLDFAQGAIGRFVPVAKRIVAAAYGRAPDHSYMVGCSTGGREGMLASERFPTYFDGIVVGAPAMRTGFSNIGLAHAAVAFNQAAPRDGQGQPLVDRIFSAADRVTILSGLLAACDGLDGAKDGWIGNPAACRFRPATLACAEGKGGNCLTPQQTAALEAAFQPPKDASGRPVYAAFPYDTGIVAEGPGLPGFLPTGKPGPLGPPNRALTLDVDKAAEGVRANGMQRLVDTDAWTNLSTFTGGGGRILYYHGVSDPWFSAWDTLDYWQRAAAANGGAAKWDGVSRLYLVPGMGHCRGGAETFDRFDLLGPLVEWVEHGVAPAAVPATRARDTQSRPLCPFPSFPQKAAEGDATASAGFACAMPRP